MPRVNGLSSNKFLIEDFRLLFLSDFGLSFVSVLFMDLLGGLMLLSAPLHGP